MRRSALVITTLARAAGSAAFAGGHEGNPAVKACNAHMHLPGFNLGILGAMAKGETDYDATLAAEAASNLATLAAFHQSADWDEGTAQEEVDGSRAKTEIWRDPAGWAEAQELMTTQAAVLAGVAANGLEALRGGVAEAGKACGTCHTAYPGPRN